MVIHGLDDLRQMRTRFKRVGGGLAILDWWLATTGACALVPLVASVEDFIWSWLLLAFVVSDCTSYRTLTHYTLYPLYGMAYKA